MQENNDLISLLEEHGLSKKEANIYLTCLKLGFSPTSTIARHSGENRTTTHFTLLELCKKGLAIQSTQQDIAYFSAISIDTFFQKQQNKLITLEKKLPELKNYTTTNIFKPKISYYDGLEGVKNIYRHILQSTETGNQHPIYSFVGSAESDHNFSTRINETFLPEDAKRRKSLVKVIIGQQNSLYAEINKKMYEYRKIDDTLFDTATEIIVFGEDEIAFFMLNTAELSGVIFQNKTLHDNLKSIFSFVRSKL